MLSPRDVAFIGCRLLAIFFAFQIAQWLPTATSLVLQAVALSEEGSATADPDVLATFVGVALRLVLQLAPAVVLWFGAAWISRRIYPTLEEQVIDARWDRKAVLSVAVAASGLFILILSLPGLFSVFWFSPGNLPLTSIFNFDAFFTMVLGIVCIVGSDSISQIVVKLRRW